MSRLESLRNYCREMSAADHLESCPTLTAKEPWWNAWIVEYEGGIPVRMRWRGPKPKWEPPVCAGCVTAPDRALFRQIADEIDAHLTRDVALPGFSARQWMGGHRA